MDDTRYSGLRIHLKTRFTVGNQSPYNANADVSKLRTLQTPPYLARREIDSQIAFGISCNSTHKD